jgi:dolichyl-diphosphooligosaccharide--protein glycosyltransferase
MFGNCVVAWVFFFASLVCLYLFINLNSKFVVFFTIGPISARVRGLFVKHTKTGNPLVDSVAEHQPASSQAYDQYLGEKIVQMVPIGFGLVALKYFHDSSSFLLVYGAATYFFSHKMVRLVLLTAPIASIFAGIVLGRLLSFFMYNIIGSVPCFFDILLIDDDDDAVKDKDELKKEPEKSPSNKSKNKAKSKKNEETEEKTSQPQNQQLNTARSIVCKLISAYAAYAILTKSILPEFEEFRGKSETIAASMSHPTIIMKAKLQSGQEVMVDDYRECYWWLRDNTPEDSRVMAWWDYGYQITAIANRTTIADGNTWNHEHIALLGRALTSSEKEGHRIARHMADYVLIWGGGGGDDLAKSPHLARIANSVYRSMCPNDPTCSRFGYTVSLFMNTFISISIFIQHPLFET